MPYCLSNGRLLGLSAQFFGSRQSLSTQIHVSNDALEYFNQYKWAITLWNWYFRAYSRQEPSNY